MKSITLYYLSLKKYKSSKRKSRIFFPFLLRQNLLPLLRQCFYFCQKQNSQTTKHTVIRNPTTFKRMQKKKKIYLIVLRLLLVVGEQARPEHKIPHVDERAPDLPPPVADHPPFVHHLRQHRFCSERYKRLRNRIPKWKISRTLKEAQIGNLLLPRDQQET